MSGDSAVTDGVNSRNSYVTVNVRHASNGTKYSVQASLEGSVEALKSAIEWESDIPSGQQQLMYKGRGLQDAYSLKSYGLEAGEHCAAGSWFL
ncbi:ubiquitin domain-containing protein DSK2b-like [Rutidosis leptorrhynchoides]|uniref:ubiquitin domain-containing protein DSK2b-like n=1 Tax=Rutidosis leptorrhynchoides TaxID=125765 RepID=UPI003A99749C